MNVAASVQANAEDILAEAQQINEERAAKAEAAAFADEAAEAEETAGGRDRGSIISDYLPDRDKGQKKHALCFEKEAGKADA